MDFLVQYLKMNTKELYKAFRFELFSKQSIVHFFLIILYYFYDRSTSIHNKLY